jgi:metal-sulfur cluster biosynthetic enzyme
MSETAQLSEDAILEALKVVIDPELGINIVDLGLVYGVEIDDELVRVEYTLTTMGCPVGPLIEQQMQQILTQMPGVKIVEGKLTFTPPWTPEMMSEEARLAMGMF